VFLPLAASKSEWLIDHRLKDDQFGEVRAVELEAVAARFTKRCVAR